MQNQQTPGSKEDPLKSEVSYNPSLSAAAAKLEELLAVHLRATHKARSAMFREWLEDNPQHQRAIDAYFLQQHLPPPTTESTDSSAYFVPLALPEADIVLTRERRL
jgi:hypothetical protein